MVRVIYENPGTQRPLSYLTTIWHPLPGRSEGTRGEKSLGSLIMDFHLILLYVTKGPCICFLCIWIFILVREQGISESVSGNYELKNW